MSALRPALRAITPILLLLPVACRVEPSLDGTPLRCTDTCPDGMRCLDGTCLNNSLPEIGIDTTQRVTVGGSLTLSASAVDADGDAVTVTWTESGNPHATLEEPWVGDELTLTFEAVGLFVYRITADDGFVPEDQDPPQVEVAVTVVNELPAVTSVTLAAGGDDQTWSAGSSSPAATFAVARADPPEEILLHAEATDADGHPVTLTWTQTLGPEVLAAPQEGPTVSFDAAELGLHQIELVPHDGYEAGDTVVVRVLVQPALDVIYVRRSDEAPAAGCGSFDAPCPSLDAGLNALGNAPGTLLVASSDVPYPGCLRLGRGQRVFGALSPESWERDPRLRATTRFECEPPADCASDCGHRLRGDGVELHDVALAWMPELSPDPNLIFDGGAEAERAFVTTLRLERDAEAAGDAGVAWLDNVDVVAAACGEGCRSMGIASLDASPQLDGVEVDADLSGFSSVEDLYGIYLLGGAPVLRSTLETVDGDWVRRGGVTLNAAVDQIAVGIMAGRSDVTLDGQTVVGGLATDLVGVGLYGAQPDSVVPGDPGYAVGAAEVADCRLDLVSFGSQGVAGIGIAPCLPGAWPCACPTAGATACGVSPEPTLAHVPDVAVHDSVIRLQGSPVASGLVPCFGLGISYASGHPGLQLLDNHVILDGAFSLGLGVTVVGAQGLVEAVPEAAVAIERNQITVADGRASYLCGLITTPIDGVSAGNVGLITVGGVGTRIVENDVRVGTHEGTSRGLVVLDAQQAWIEGNGVEVGQRGGAILNDTAVAVRLGANLSSGEWRSTFTRNDVRLGYGILNGLALELTGRSPWLVSNNFVNVGPTLYGGGIQIGVGGNGSSWPWPKLYHNTIHAGGGLVGQAIRLNEGGGGVLAHNLIDGGAPSGERFLFYDPAPGDLAELRDNLGQFVDEIGGPRPGLILPPGTGVTEGTGIGSDVNGPIDGGGVIGGIVGGGIARYNPVSSWTVLFEGSGTLNQIREEGTGSGLRRWESFQTFGPPVAAWSGVDRGVDRLLIITEIPGRDGNPARRLFALAPLEGGQVATVIAVAPRNPAGNRWPEAAVMADDGGDGVLDILFIERDTTGDGPDTLFVMDGIPGGGFAPAVALEQHSSLRFLEVESDGAGVFYLADFIHPPSDQPEPTLFFLGDSSSPYLEQGPVPVQDFVAGGATMAAIERFAMAELREEATNQPLAADLLLVVSGRLHVASRADRSASPSAATFDTPACVDTEVVAVAVGDALDEPGVPIDPPTGNEIVVGCANERVEVFAGAVAADGTVSFSLIATTDVGGTINGLAVDEGDGTDAQILVSRLGETEHSLALLTLSRGTRAFVNGVAPLSLLSDVVQLDGNPPQPMAEWSGAEEEVRILDGESCSLMAREPGGDRFDLHLTGEPTDLCADPSAYAVDRSELSAIPELQGLADDIDGLGTRTDDALDIGADEIDP